MPHSKSILVYGLGKEGIAAANYLSREYKVSIVEDKKREDLESQLVSGLQKQKIGLFFEGKLPAGIHFDLVVRSPGVKPKNHLLQKIIKGGAKISSSTAIFFEKCPAQIIGVTGTKGKGTSSTLIYNILKEAGKDVYLAGNIGIPMLEILPKLSKKSIVVLELSSFQLIDLKASPHVAVVLMITSEHLDWHKNQREYVQAKLPIVTYQTKNDFAVINWDFPISQSFAPKTKAKKVRFSTNSETVEVFVKDNRIISNIGGKKEDIVKLSQIRLPGKHNLQNICAAVAVAKIMDIPSDVVERAISKFTGLPNRLELIKKVNGVSFYNDSFSTTPETTIAAIDAFDKPKIIILGGSSKKSDFSALAAKIANTKSVKAIVLIGEEANTIKGALERSNSKVAISEGAKSMHDVISQAKNFSKKGDVVLLSPACASFDMFENYLERGKKFREEVLKIQEYQ